MVTRLLLCLLILAGCSHGGGFVEDDTLTDDEVVIIEKARSAHASLEDRTRAESICQKKCKICFDGRDCDLGCALRNCRRE